MKWTKLGRVFQVDGTAAWMQSHAGAPCALRRGTHEYRVYFTSRDQHQRSHVGWFDIDLRQPSRILGVADTPCLGPGRPGQFDDSGTTLTWIHDQGQKALFYYVGWNRGVSVPFRNALGLAALNPAGHLDKLFEGPILDRSIHDPCFVGSACVCETDSGWQMWYLSCIAWEPQPTGPRHRYHLKHATSNDGIKWDRAGRVCIDFQHEGEFAISRPSVIRDDDRYRMWYSYRGDSYRIGYAESRNGLDWTRMDDDVGISASADGWDSAMIGYGHVFDCDGRRYMLYNGNNYGATGIGLAVLEQD